MGSAPTFTTPQVERPSASTGAEAHPVLVHDPRDTPRSSRKLRAILIVSDIAAVGVAWFIAGLLAMGESQSLMSFHRLGYWPAGVALTVAAIAINKLYRARVCSVRSVETAALLRAVTASGLVQLAIADNVGRPDGNVARVVVGQGLAFIAVWFGRSLYRGVLKRQRRSGRLSWPVVIVGTGAEGYELYRLLQAEPELGYAVQGVVGDPVEVSSWDLDVPFLGPVTATVDAVRRAGATGVIIGASSLQFRELNDVVRSLLHAGVHVQVSGGLFGFDATRLQANPIGREAAFYLEQVSLTGWQSRVKRTLDVVVASLLLVPAAPIVAIAALMVRRDGGPALFRQQRVGRDGELFTILKLRTMIVDAEKKLPELMAANERNGPLFKMSHDPRFTRIGRFLDATSLNELPQLINVLRGEMSIVGPRPALAREVAAFDERLLLRHRVRPGITGLWQVEGRDSPSFEAYERCDVFYVENWSVRLDLAIMLQTVGEVARRAVAMFSRTRTDSDAQLRAIAQRQARPVTKHPFSATSPIATRTTANSAVPTATPSAVTGRTEGGALTSATRAS